MIITDKAQIKVVSFKEFDKLHLTTSDELECYELIESDLKLPADATFTRSSPAYLSDGTQVPANLPRFEQGKFGKAVMVEEGTVNAISNPSFESGLTGWSTSGAQVTIDTTKKWHGMQAAKLTANATNVSLYQRISVSPGQVWSVSAYIETLNLTGNYLFFKVQWFNNGVFVSQASAISVFGTSAMSRRIHNNLTVPTGVNQLHIEIQLPPGVLSGIAWVDAVQAEQKPYATSFIDGTRSPESLTIPGNVLNPQEGTVEFWVYPFNTVKTFDYDRLLFGSTGSRPGVFWCNINPNQQLRFVYDSNGVSVILTGGTVPNLSWSRITIRWNTSGVACFINGVLVASDPRLITAISGAVLHIGSYSTQYYANILIDDLRISNRARTDAEILAAYQSGQPLAADEWTTYKLDFDDKVRITTQGQIVCNELIEI